jgi:hypothetical protein
MKYKITLTSYGTNKLGVVAAISALLRKSLRDSKLLAEQAPSVLSDSIATQEEADNISAKLVDAGATVTCEQCAEKEAVTETQAPSAKPLANAECEPRELPGEQEAHESLFIDGDSEHLIARLPSRAHHRY